VQKMIMNDLFSRLLTAGWPDYFDRLRSVEASGPQNELYHITCNVLSIAERSAQSHNVKQRLQQRHMATGETQQTYLKVGRWLPWLGKSASAHVGRDTASVTCLLCYLRLLHGTSNIVSNPGVLAVEQVRWWFKNHQCEARDCAFGCDPLQSRTPETIVAGKLSHISIQGGCAPLYPPAL
jgi:hypothetical protein